MACFSFLRAILLFLLMICALNVNAESLDYAYAKKRSLDFASELITKRKYNQAHDYLKELQINHPDDPAVFALLAKVEILKSGFDSKGKVLKTKNAYRAVRYLRSAIELDADNQKYKMALANLLGDLERYEKSESIYKELFSDSDFRKGKDTRYLIIDYAVILQSLGKTIESLEEYRNSLLATNYDKKIFYAYIGGLSYSGQISNMQTEYEIYEKNHGFNGNVKYKLCKELLAHKEYKHSQTCYLDLLEKPNVHVHLRRQAKIDLSYVEENLK